MSEPRVWKQIGGDRWVCEPWTITRYTVSGGDMFALWKGEAMRATGYSADRGDLMRMAKLLDEGEKNVRGNG